MSIFIETPEIKILADAGAALGPRFGMIPHPKEYESLRKARKKIRQYAEMADAITISHYHLDHYTATWNSVDAKWTWSSYEEARKIYGGKLILAKDYRDKINPSQRRRAYIFHKIVGDFVKEVRFVDDQSLKLGKTELIFSPPFPHGEEDGSLGYIILLTVTRGGETLMYCPDVQGPMESSTLEYILSSNPDVLVIGGPPSYLSPKTIAEESIRKAMRNLRTISKKVPLTLLDHHILRDEKAVYELRKFSKSASVHGNKMMSYAEYLGEEVRTLEAIRPRLYEEFPPSQAFQRWARLPPLQQRSQLPPR